jgi:hypothetical protein
MTEIKVYCFACTKDNQTYVACLDGSHAAIRPIGEVIDGSRTLLLYTNYGAAKKALASRRIHPLSVSWSNHSWSGDPVLVYKSALKVRVSKLTLDL